MFNLVGSVFSSFGKSWFGHQVDTLVDKLNRNLTVFLFIAFAILVSAQQYVGNPIHCRHQSINDGNFDKYMDEVCWVTNTYYIPQGEVFQGKELDEYRRINYYQWVPLVLLVQALMFYLPHLFWQGMLLRSGLDLASLVTTGIQVHVAENTEEREKKVRYMACQLDGYLTHYQGVREEEAGCLARCSGKIFQALSRLFCGKRAGSYLVLLYVITKMLYTANAIGQFFVLDRFLSSDIHLYGWTVFKSVLGNGDWPESEIFPKSTICRFDLHAFGGELHTNVVQCVLPVNFFHDKLYVLIWFWLVIIAVANCVSLLAWVMRFLLRVDRSRFVNHHLRALGRVYRGKEGASTGFVGEYLRQDGVFVLRLINRNVSGLVCAQLAGALWDQFKGKSSGGSLGFYDRRRASEAEVAATEDTMAFAEV